MTRTAEKDFPKLKIYINKTTTNTTRTLLYYTREKQKINNFVVSILLDVGSIHTIITCALMEKLKLKSRERTKLTLEKILNSNRDCELENVSLEIPTMGQNKLILEAYKVDDILTTNDVIDD